MRSFTLPLILCFVVPLASAQFIQEKTYNLPSGSLGNLLAKGDFNGDGKLDLLFSGNKSGLQLVVFPGNGLGGFSTPILTPVTANAAVIVTAGDVNGDGIPDVILTATDSITGVPQIGVMLADGTGKFGAPILFDTTLRGTFVLGDFTGDKKTDLAVLGSPLTVLPGHGDGTFGAGISSGFAWSANCGVAADFNKDGKLDLTTANAVLLGNGDGTFQSPVTLGGFCGVAVGDFNNDGVPDLVTGKGPFNVGGNMGVLVFLGDGTGKFTLSASYNTGIATESINHPAVDYFNADSNQDIAVSNDIDGDVTILLGDGTGKFTIGKSFATSVFNIVSGDFNGDHKTDIAAMNRQGFSVLLGNGDGTLKAELAQNFQPGAKIHLADFNGDGKIDAFEFGNSTHPSAVLLGDGTGAFGTPISASLSCKSSDGVIADFNGDKKPDVAFVEGTGGGVGVCLGNGDGTFNGPFVSDSGVQHSQVASGDFNHDGKMDLAAVDVGGISLLLGNGDGTFKSAILTALSGIGYLTTGDFNHDGKLDLVALVNSSELVVLLGNGDGTFKAPITAATGLSAYPPIAVGDLNGDGFPDLVVAGGGGYYVVLNNGDGTFKAPVSHPLFGPGNLQLRDLNKDGKLDLVATAPGLVDVLLGNGDGTFQKAKNYTAPSGTVSIGVADINGDGFLDIVYLKGTSSAKTSMLDVFLNIY